MRFWEWLKRFFGFGEKKAEPAPTPAPKPAPDIPARPAGPSIPQPGSTPEPVDVVLDDGGGDIYGDRRLARTVDPSNSDFKILGHGKLYAPGDTVQFYVKAVAFPDENGKLQPIPGLPVIVTNKAQARRLAGPVTTNAAGEAVLSYVVQDADMKGDLSTPEPDSGSWICIAYAGGRLLNKVVALWDVA